MNKSDVSLIEEQLSNLLRIIEFGLTNLDIEAAHLLNPPGFKNSHAPENEFSTNYIKPLVRIAEKKKVNSLDSFQKIPTFKPPPFPKTNDRILPCLSQSSTESASSTESESSIESISKDTTNPPDLTFSFYSSTQDIIPLSTSLLSKSPSESSELPLNNIIHPTCPTLEKILSSPRKAHPISENGLKSQTSNAMEQSHVESKLEEPNSRSSKKNRSSNVKAESDDSVIEMHDLVESLMKIKSALDNLDIEAAYLLNPPGFKTSYCDPSAQAPSSLEDNEFYPLKDN